MTTLNTAILGVLQETNAALSVTTLALRVRSYLSQRGVRITTADHAWKHRVNAALSAMNASGMVTRVGHGMYCLGNGTPPVAPVVTVATSTAPAPAQTMADTGDAVSAALATLASVDPAELLAAAKRLTREHMARLRDAEDAIRSATAIAREEAAA